MIVFKTRPNKATAFKSLLIALPLILFHHSKSSPASSDHLKQPNVISPLPDTSDDESAAPAGPAGLGEEEQDAGACGVRAPRLPKWVQPRHYDLVLMADLNLLTFQGIVQIDVDIKSPADYGAGESEAAPAGAQPKSNQILLNADDSLSVAEIWFSSRDGETNTYLSIKNVCRDPQQQLVVINLAQELQANTSGQLHLTFAGQLSESLRGFYMSPYEAREDGAERNSTRGAERRFAGVTQFEPMEARRAFPCFDEPALKASFNLTLISQPSNRLALSNTEPLFEQIIGADEERKLAERRLVKFKQTPPMSTYLLAFVLGEFDFLEERVDLPLGRRKLPIRVYVPRGQQRAGEFALDIAKRAVLELEDFFQIEYSLGKLDLVSVSAFEAGAMENWGLVTFKEMQLLVFNSEPDKGDEEFTSEEQKALIAGTIVHELAHQWFGNLVTMKWWNDIWLNEGFATWLEFKLTGKFLYPSSSSEQDYNCYYLLNSHIHALNEDSFRQIHPIRPEEEQIELGPDVDELFDAISYHKAASIIRIIESNLMKSEEELKLKLRDYIGANEFNSTDYRDLYKFLKISPKSIEIADSWLKQAGHPMLRVRLVGDNNELQIGQERFHSSAKELTKSEAKQLWKIPILIELNSPNRSQILRVDLMERSAKFKLPSWFSLAEANSNSASWLKLNANFTGFYRVLYENEHIYKRFKRPIEELQMSPADRLNLLDEIHTLTIGNRLPASQLLESLSWFRNENNGAVLEALVGAFDAFFRIYQHERELSAKIALFGRKLLGDLFEKNSRFKLKPNSASKLIDSVGKSSLLSALIYLNHTQAIEESLGLFRGMSKVPLEVDFKGAIYVAVSKFGSDEEFRKLFQLFGASRRYKEEQVRLAKAMAKANSIKRLEFTWQWLRKLPVDNDLDRMEILSLMLNTRAGRELVLQLLEKSLPELVQLNGDKSIGSLVEELALAMDPREFKARLGNLFLRHKNAADWLSATEYIKRMLSWQLSIRSARGSAPDQVGRQLDGLLQKLR